ncbi:MAG: PLP-dependent aspartate aminotransferase family protein [Actinobacteria bacterium]|nr:PLP-dependent aspartate aminotransferase family protein [Actinomycetota bacterium]MDA2961401.1 PLP-dependent aspartate aminotransferase family protein [Actinomycetota bacterium]MDA2993912.1 PLP-dependent aspartate aminotransferase family protein [Actinomycetota bacterium]
MNDNSSHDQSTRAISSGRRANEHGLAVPIWATAVWESDSAEHAYDMAHSVGPDDFYSRHGNPTVSAFTDSIADLEDAESALAFASGMGALASVVFGLCSAGSHIVATKQIYGTTTTFLNGPAARMGIETTWVNGGEPGAMAAAVIPGRTMLVIAETPSNPLLDIVDLDELGAIKGPFTMVDSTFATPFGQQPIRHGVDLVLHSATKGIAGHNDATLGVVAGERELLDDIWRYGILHGATASPFDAMLALRGVRSLDVRHDRQCSTALEIARRLQHHAAVAKVHYPGLADHPHHDLAARQMRRFGSVVSLQLANGDGYASLVEQLQLVRCATSLGGPETLICESWTTTHSGLDEDSRREIGINPGLIRMSLGLESAEDLWDDLDRALSSL